MSELMMLFGVENFWLGKCAFRIYILAVSREILSCLVVWKLGYFGINLNEYYHREISLVQSVR